MARWGEGDPRWLVEERPDATNVNNWHWSEKNASIWSKEKFSELLIGTKIEADFGYCEITEILKCEGDAVVINRKGKLLYFYEWNLEIKWIGVASTEDAVVDGKVSVLNLTEEFDIKGTEIRVNYDENESSKCFGNIMENQGKKKILELLEAYITALKKNFSSDIILPSKYSFSDKTVVKKIPDQRYASEQKSYENVAIDSRDMGELHIVENFKCTAEEIYRALTVRELVQIFTQCDCILEPKEGGKFEIFGGNVQGYFCKLQPFHTLVLKWRVSTWPRCHFSDVIIAIYQKADFTEIKLSQFRVPTQEIENTREGWKNHYWDNIKRAFGYGAFLF